MKQLQMIEDTRVQCPYCGEMFDTVADCSAGDQDYVEDCPVCCQPIEFHLSVDFSGQFSELVAGRDSD